VIGAVLGRADRVLMTGCRWIVVGCFAGLFLLLSLGIVQRMLPAVKLSGYDELVELLFIWMTFIGALALWRDGALYRVSAIDRLLPGGARRTLTAVIHLSMLAVALLLAIKGWEFTQLSGETTPFLQADKRYWYVVLPISGALMALYSVAAAWRTLTGAASTTADAGTLIG
jgi:TRAP-type C4-dicarboxylate transport system permease small subunit